MHRAHDQAPSCFRYHCFGQFDAGCLRSERENSDRATGCCTRYGRTSDRHCGPGEERATPPRASVRRILGGTILHVERSASPAESGWTLRPSVCGGARGTVPASAAEQAAMVAQVSARLARSGLPRPDFSPHGPEGIDPWRPWLLSDVRRRMKRLRPGLSQTCTTSTIWPTASPCCRGARPAERIIAGQRRTPTCQFGLAWIGIARLDQWCGDADRFIPSIGCDCRGAVPPPLIAVESS